MKKMDKKAFTLIELIVVIAIIGILVLLGIPRFANHIQGAELARIQHDVKVMEQEIGTEFINKDDDFDNWENNNKDFTQLIQEGKLFEKKGVAYEEPIDGPYKVIPEEYKDKINTKLKGTFYANSGGKVYYEHTKPLFGIPTEPSESGEKEPVYSDEEMQDLINDGYIPVATADELNNVRINEERTYGAGTEWEGLYTGGLDKKYIQVANIDLSVYSGEGWNPIGTEPSSFRGTYDGGNYVIRDLEVKGEGNDYQGLFGYTEGATISNVGLTGNKVTGSSNVGGLVGWAGNSTKIRNSYATGSVNGAESVGGLVGRANISTEITNSHATGPVTGSRYVGGLVGWARNSTKIRNSYATGPVTGTGDQVGGLVGYASSNTMIENSYATGSVEGGTDIGGLVGYAYDSITISNSYATGSVTGSGSRVGGLVGQAGSSTISNSYATGSVEGTGSYVGGLVGMTHSSTKITKITNSYWDVATSGQSSSEGGLGKTTDNMMKQTTYSGWDFVNVWEIDEGNDYPKLRYKPESPDPEEQGPEYPEEIQGLIDEGYIPVANVGDLYSIRLNERYVQVADIDLSRYSTWTPLGTGPAPFTGTYDGGNYVIKGLTVNGGGGLFGIAQGATIRNVGLIGNTVKGGGNVGGLAGVAMNSTISNSYTTGSVTGTGNQVGGLVGYAGSNTKITNSYTTGQVNGSMDVGGLVGMANSSTISNTYATGSVTGSRNVGGLVGTAGSGTVTSSYWNAETTGQYSSAGGGTGLTTWQMKNQLNYYYNFGWNPNIWEITPGNYPTLR